MSKITPHTNDLFIQRVFDAPASLVFRAWTEPELMKVWFCPKPWGVSRVVNDVRTGGNTLVVMQSPEGQEFPNPGVYLEVIPNKRIVFTDAYSEAWLPSAKPFFTGIVDLEEKDGKTHYTAIARHWTEEDRKTHEAMGFHEGWSKAADQLAELLVELQAKA